MHGISKDIRVPRTDLIETYTTISFGKMKNILCALCALWGFASLSAQEKPSLNIGVETRIGYHYEAQDGDAQHPATGFKGDYLNLKVSGEIARGFSYAWRQRINKTQVNNSFFDATDWLYLSWQADRHWTLSAGKQVVAIGGFEYDRAPINIYTGSEFWNNIGCYQFGGSVTYTTGRGDDHYTLQVCGSPFQPADVRNLYAVNLMWSGRHGCLSTLYSANMLEYAPGRFISYLALGHRFDWHPVSLELDLMNRAASHQVFLLKDCSLMALLEVKCGSCWNLFGKYTYDVNRTHTDADCCVRQGTELSTLGAGAEFFPKIAGQDVRLHAVLTYVTGDAHPDAVLQDKELKVSAGLTWRFRLK